MDVIPGGIHLQDDIAASSCGKFLGEANGVHSRRTTVSDSRGTSLDRTSNSRSPPARLPDFVDKLETALAKCLADYRHHAEEALANHLAEIEEAQAAQEHQIASLVVENCQLRERLGMKPADTLQKMLFQNNPPVSRKSSKSVSRASSKRACRTFEEDGKLFSSPNNRRPLNFRANAAFERQSHGGMWQAFMAWVPTGAAMQNPEPWKPLPQDQLLALPPNSQVSTPARQLGHRQPSPRDHLSAILPGTPSEHHVAVKLNVNTGNNDEESDDDSDSQSRSSCSKREEFALLDLWVASEKVLRKMKRNSESSRSDGASSLAYGEDDGEFGTETKPWFVLDPDSNIRIAWDILSLIMICYDVVMIPMGAFELPEDAWFIFMDWCTRIFWTLDMGWSCCTGVVMADGVVEYNTRSILRRYIKTWFGADLIMNVSDWVGAIISNGDMSLMSLARIMRMARVLRLLRLLKMQDVVANITERIQSDAVGIAFLASKFLLVLLLVSHYFASLWWAVGSRDTSGPTWVKENSYVSAGIAAQYLVSVYWALCQFSGGTDEIVPASSVERLCAVLVGVAGFMLSLSMLGTLTSALTQQYIIDGTGARQLAALKTYLKQHKIRQSLSKRLCRNAKHAISSDMSAESVQLLGVISEPLKVLMHFQMYSRVLYFHPFFTELLNDGNQLVRRICHQAMAFLFLDHGDIVFELNEEAAEPKMYIVDSGSLDYMDAYGETATVDERSCISEPALWTRWRHMGTLMAKSNAKLATIDAQSFHDLCKQQITHKKSACLPLLAYAAAFVKELNQKEMLSDLSDS